jgi:membrane protein DedA with SNARE-associated domain
MLTLASANPPGTVLPGFLSSLAGPLDHYGYLVIALLLLLENIGIPVIPGEFALIAGAIFAGNRRAGLNVELVGTVAVVATIAGAEIGYLIGRLAGRQLILRHGRYVLIKPDHLARAEAVVERYGGIVVVIARFIVGLREANGIVAGLSQMRWFTFALFNVIGACVWVGTWVSVGYLAGDHITSIYNGVNRFAIYLFIALAVLLVGYIARRVVRHRRSRRAREASGARDSGPAASERSAAQEGLAPGDDYVARDDAAVDDGSVTADNSVTVSDSAAGNTTAAGNGTAAGNATAAGNGVLVAEGEPTPPASAAPDRPASREGGEGGEGREAREGQVSAPGSRRTGYPGSDEGSAPGQRSGEDQGNELLFRPQVRGIPGRVALQAGQLARGRVHDPELALAQRRLPRHGGGGAECSARYRQRLGQVLPVQADDRRPARRHQVTDNRPDRVSHARSGDGRITGTDAHRQRGLGLDGPSEAGRVRAHGLGAAPGRRADHPGARREAGQQVG